MLSQQPIGLRDRQRRLTSALIRQTTIELLERQGWEATTVAEIAAQSGVSSRTFFRYFESKEHAAFPAHQHLWLAASTFTPTSISLGDVAREVTDLLRSSMVIANEPEEQEVHRRIARLFGASPQLCVVASTQDAEITLVLYERLIALLPDVDPLELRGIVESAMTLWRTAWWLWGTRLHTADAASPADSFASAARIIQGIRLL